ncbi:MAG: hypothetical protein IT260_10655 [Saprospiraceae bacterium]|nr:hypothetical protein [Saprospiraceae bacterium]
MLLFFLLLRPLPIAAQDNCYEFLYTKGNIAFADGRYAEALKKWEGAQTCPDKPLKNDVDDRIRQAQARIEALAAANAQEQTNASDAKPEKDTTGASKKEQDRLRQQKAAEEERRRQAEAERQRQAEEAARRQQAEDAAKKQKIGGNLGKPGTGPSISVSGQGLAARKVVKRPSAPKVDTKANGRVAVQVCVDSKGNVISADYTLKGSTTTNQQLIGEALHQARQFQFATSDVEKQCGSIFFDFREK